MRNHPATGGKVARNGKSGSGLPTPNIYLLPRPLPIYGRLPTSFPSLVAYPNPTIFFDDVYKQLHKRYDTLFLSCHLAIPTTTPGSLIHVPTKAVPIKLLEGGRTSYVGVSPLWYARRYYSVCCFGPFAMSRHL